MGGLIPNPHDDRVKQKLDKQFSDPHLRNLRNRIDKGHPPTEPNFFFDPVNPRHLARISYRLKIWPDPDTQAGEPPPTTTQLKARWQYLLQILLTDPIKAGQSGSTVAELIRNALQVFVVTDDPQTAGLPQCTAITFDVIKAPLPGLLDYQVNINPDPTVPRPAGNYVATIQLVCRQEIPAGVTAPDPGPDPGEVLPAQPSFLAKSKPTKKPPKKPPPKKAAKKKKKAGKKKLSKKAAKKTAKKTKKKVARKARRRK